MMIPKVSVGLPVYNGEKYIEGAILSILKQDFEDFELIISDNGSNDKTAHICMKYAAIDNRIKYHRSDTNHGAAWNYNKVVSLSKGEYFKWATHDDECLPSFLTKCIKILQNNDDIVLAYTSTRFIDNVGNFLYDDEDRLETLFEKSYLRLWNTILNISNSNAIFGVIRREAMNRTRLIGPFIASDYVFLAELSILGKFMEIQEHLFLHRLHPKASMYLNKTNTEKLYWFDPKTSIKIKFFNKFMPKTMVRIKLVKEWFISAWKTPNKYFEKTVCVVIVPLAFSTKMMRTYLGKLKRKVVNISDR